MTADDLAPGVAYFYIGGNAQQPIERYYQYPHRYRENTYVFAGPTSSLSYTLIGPELRFLFASEADAWDALGDEVEAGSSVFVAMCRIRAKELRQTKQ